jgi:SAM-dependent methyltransferase
MAVIGGRIAGLILSRYEWNETAVSQGYEGMGKLAALFDPATLARLRGKTVVDFGCGRGQEALELARGGAAEVIGLELRDELIAKAQADLAKSGIRNCTFLKHYDGKADVVLSVDAFEHFDRPDLVLEEMTRLLKPDGFVLFSFGPPWYHPRGGHFPLFPWAHLILTERSLMKWRSGYKTDGATRFGEVAGGLNQMSLRRFERLVAASRLKLETFEPVPIRAAHPLHCRLTSEFLTSVVRGTLVHR